MRKIDGKFSTDGTRIFNTVSGIDIPDDEPLFVLRARDRNAVKALILYQNECRSDGCNILHLTGISHTIDKFLAFVKQNPDKMKEPGVTKHLRL